MVIKTSAKTFVNFLKCTKTECNGYIDVANQIAKAHPENSPSVFNNQYMMYLETEKYCDKQIEFITKEYSPNDVIELIIDVNE